MRIKPDKLSASIAIVIAMSVGAWRMIAYSLIYYLK